MKKTLLIVFLITFNTAFAQVSIDESQTTQELIQDSFIGNPNFPASNFVSGTGTDFGDANGIGYFYANGADLPFEEGLILSTGNVASAPGTNTSILSNGGASWIGDADLEAYTSGTNTFNATSIGFDFQADVPIVSLDFVFASEEYGTSECVFGDTFAFLLTELNTGITYNIAFVPGTTTPISVINVRGGDNTSCGSLNETYFGRYNYTVADASIPSIAATDSPINFNGQTDVFVLVENLNVGSNYHIKIVVGDHQDSIFDSALFVRNSSFGAYPIIEEEPEDVAIDDVDGNGEEVFNLRTFETQMLGSTIDTSVYSFDFSYHLSEADAEMGINAIANPSTYTNVANLQDIYVRMQNSYTETAVTTSFKITIDPALLSTPEFQLNSIAVYPNPVLDELLIDTETLKTETIEVYNINGQLIKSQNKTETNTIKIDFSNLDNGVYLVKINSENGSIYKRIVK